MLVFGALKLSVAKVVSLVVICKYGVLCVWRGCI